MGEVVARNCEKMIGQEHVACKWPPTDLTHGVLLCPLFSWESQMLLSMSPLERLLKYQLSFTHLSSDFRGQYGAQKPAFFLMFPRWFIDCTLRNIGINYMSSELDSGLSILRTSCACNYILAVLLGFVQITLIFLKKKNIHKVKLYMGSEQKEKVSPSLKPVAI